MDREEGEGAAFVAHLSRLALFPCLHTITARLERIVLDALRVLQSAGAPFHFTCPHRDSACCSWCL